MNLFEKLFFLSFHFENHVTRVKTSGSDRVSDMGQTQAPSPDSVSDFKLIPFETFDRKHSTYTFYDTPSVRNTDEPMGLAFWSWAYQAHKAR